MPMIRMRLPLAMLLASLTLFGCTVHQSIGKSTGAFLHPVSGPDFVHIADDRWNHNNALVYFYRPHSQWAADELESPSVYIDDRQYFNIRDGSFTWLEVKPGERQIKMRRPLLGLEGLNGMNLSLIVDATLTTRAGEIYYLRYSEISTPDQPFPGLDPEDPLANGDLQRVTRAVAMGDGELVATHFLNSDMLAPNHAARSIVRVNEDDDYQRDMARLETERDKELVRLEQQGRLKDAPWYWPFGGGPAKPLATDREIARREQAYAQLQQRRERQDKQDSRSWWPFW